MRLGSGGMPFNGLQSPDAYRCVATTTMLTCRTHLLKRAHTDNCKHLKSRPLLTRQISYGPHLPSYWHDRSYTWLISRKDSTERRAVLCNCDTTDKIQIREWGCAICITNKIVIHNIPTTTPRMWQGSWHPLWLCLCVHSSITSQSFSHLSLHKGEHQHTKHCLGTWSCNLRKFHVPRALIRECNFCL